EKSTFSPGPILKPIGPNFTTIQAVDNGLKFVSDGVDAKGRTTHGEFTVSFDGMDSFYTQLVLGRPDPDSAPTTVSLKRIDDRTLNPTRGGAGGVSPVATLVFWWGGRAGTATTTGFNADGTTSISTVFYDRL